MLMLRTASKHSVCRGYVDKRALAPSRCQHPHSAQPVGNTPWIEQNPVNLAYLGDSVWEVYVRKTHFFPPQRHSAYNTNVKAMATAEAQARMFDRLLSCSMLSDDEVQLLSWAQNYKHINARGRLTTPEGQQIYRKATAFEALVGYLHLSDHSRLEELMKKVLQDGFMDI